MPRITARSPLRQEHLHLPNAPSAGAAMHEDWWAEAHREGASVVVSLTADDPRGALAQLLRSTDPVDDLFQDVVRSLTGLEVVTIFDRT